MLASPVAALELLPTAYQHLAVMLQMDGGSVSRTHETLAKDQGDPSLLHQPLGRSAETCHGS